MPKTLLEQNGPTTSSPGTGAQVPAHDEAGAEVYALPATQGQIRFWSLDQLNPGNPALNMPLMWQCTGELDAALLEDSFTRCLERHESLRTTFEMTGGKLSQIIHPGGRAEIALVDLSTLSGEARRIEADRLTREHAAFRFDLLRGPLLVLKLLRFNERHHLLLVTMHHIICDGISNGILMRDMIAFYRARLADQEPDLPGLPIQFADFAVFQEEWRANTAPGSPYAESLGFWHRTLGKDFTPLQLTHDPDARASLPEFSADATGAIETLLVPPDLNARAHAFCRGENVTLNILLFSVFAALLHRLTGQRDLTIGSPCANRTEETQELIGLFMNIQVLRLQLGEDATFRDLLAQVAEWTIAASEHQMLPFEDLVHDPFFSQGAQSFEIPVFFLYQKSFMLTARIPTPRTGRSLEIVPLRSESPGAVFDMMFAIVDREEEGPRLQLEYNPQFYEAATIHRYLRLFVNLLDAAIATPGRNLGQLEILSAGERAKLLTQGTESAVDFGPMVPVHEAILARLRSDPERIAVSCGAASDWTAGDLVDFATGLAKKLVAEGLQPGDLVGIHLGRSREMAGALLAVLMAGGAYLPLDPRYPRARLTLLLEDSSVGYILTDRELAVPTSARLLRIHGPAVAAPGVALPTGLTEHSLAYVIYTSGSTGTPKGVAIEHGALRNVLLSLAERPGVTGSDVFVAITTLSFDIATLELLLPLLTGARLVIATDEQVLTPRLLADLLEQSEATVLQATPGAWRTLIEAGWSGARPLKVLCGGDSLSRDLADQLLARSSDVWNLYGPTEATIWSAVTRILPGEDPMVMGTAVANTQFYVLNPHHDLVPAGVTGELFIGGAGLARGYWNRPELTSERFIQNPFGEGRLYATGDLARPCNNGSFRLLGRADFQVKIRGYRIELGEIEAALRRHKDVRDAVVVQKVLRERVGQPGINRLVAYVAAGERADSRESATLIEELEAHLSRTLPDYMTPNAIVALPRLPMNANGKLDRAALPEVFEKAGDSGIRSALSDHDGFVKPRDVIERQLTEIWQTTLGIAKISVRASFFSLGVGSLAALRLITKMNRVYGTDLGLASLISASSIESIATLIRDRFSPNTTSSLVPIQPSGDRPPVFIVHGIGGNVVNFYGLSMRMTKDQPVYGIQSQALIANQPALLHLKDMAAHYLAEIRQVQPHGPYRLLGYSFGGTVVLEMAHQLRAAGEEVSMVGMLDSRSKDYEEEFAQTTSVQTRISNRLDRFLGNTGQLSWSERFGYISEKLRTRAIRLASRAAANLNFTRVPAFMRSAEDINLVAVQNYKLKPYDGRLILFRATEQEIPDAPYDLGWSAIFTGGVEVHDLPGDHERIFLEPNIDVLAASLHQALEHA